MKINQLKINAYGKLKDIQMHFGDHINIIYGKNEAGKSTLLNFITKCFYGISKNKKGKEISDFEKYIPWVGEEFSGKLTYELDNQQKFEVFRDFKKKNPKIFDDKMVDISKEFNIDKNTGSEFFYEQTKVDEELFLSTLIVNQQAVKLQAQEQSRLIQKIANLAQTGQDNISFQRAMERLDRRKLEEIGTERSREKPINVLTRKIEQLEKEKQELEKYETIKYELREKKNQVKDEILKLEGKNNEIKKLKLIYENEKIENEKINIKIELKNKNEEKIKSIQRKVEEVSQNYKNIFEKRKKIKKEKTKGNIAFITTFLLILFLVILSIAIMKNYTLSNIFLVMIPIISFIFVIFRSKITKKQRSNQKEIDRIDLETNQCKQEIHLLEENNAELEKQIQILKNEVEQKIKKNSFLETNTESDNSLLEDINREIQALEDKINEQKIKLHTLELDEQNIEPKLDNLSCIEEELTNNIEKKNNLKKLEKSIDLAKEVLEISYEEMKNMVTPKFTQKLSKIIAEITNGKYTNIRLQEQEGVMVELENGNYMPASRLSIGTIDQLYLSLRLAMTEELSKEKMPIILDEAFAYYDTERLKNILIYLSEKFKEHQIILFTCTDRETKLLNELKIPYDLNILDR